METVNLSLAEAYVLIYKVLRGNGLSEAHATMVAMDVIHGEHDDCASHGSWLLLGVVETRRKGKVSPDAEPVITDTVPAIAKVDAGGVFSLLASERALSLLIGKAHHNGIVVPAINRCVHFSALFIDVGPFTGVGLAALATTLSYTWIVPAGRMQPPFDTNPVAFGWPHEEEPPFIFDTATSAAARGEIQLHRRAGKTVPEGWGIDGDGRTTTDAQAILDGVMSTSGGHRGSALVAMVEPLTGSLIGDITSAESPVWGRGAGRLPYGDELILVLDPTRFPRLEAPQHLAHAERLFADMQRQGARLPGGRRYHSRMYTICDGAEIARFLLKDVSALVEQLSREQEGRCPSCYTCIVTYSFFTLCFE